MSNKTLTVFVVKLELRLVLLNILLHEHSFQNSHLSVTMEFFEAVINSA